MNTNRTPKSEIRKLTHMGRRSLVTTTYHSSSPTGLREIRTEYVDEPANGSWPAGSITTRRVTGDGRKGTLVVVSEERSI